MPIHYEDGASGVNPTAPPNLATWPYPGPADPTVLIGPVATQRLFDPHTRQLVVSVGMPLPANHELLLTEDDVFSPRRPHLGAPVDAPPVVEVEQATAPAPDLPQVAAADPPELIVPASPTAMADVRRPARGR